MELYHYLSIVWRRWPIVLALPLLAGLFSLVAIFNRPPRYEVTARLLITRTDILKAGVNEASLPVEDTVAYDLPSIINSELFMRDIADQLARRGHPIDLTVLQQSIEAKNKFRPVVLTVTTSSPDDALPIAQAALDLIKTRGLYYWGDAAATPEDPGINVVVLDPLPSQPILSNNMKDLLLELSLRALTGLLAGVGIAFGLHYLSREAQPAQARVNG